jgi:hypothetical protein
MLSRRLSPGGSAIVRRRLEADVFGVAAVARFRQAAAGAQHGVAFAEGGSVDATTWPATSMPPLSGKRRRILPWPVPARASL